jgi:hypothetical protein
MTEPVKDGTVVYYRGSNADVHGYYTIASKTSQAKKSTDGHTYQLVESAHSRLRLELPDVMRQDFDPVPGYETDEIKEVPLGSILLNLLPETHYIKTVKGWRYVAYNEADEYFESVSGAADEDETEWIDNKWRERHAES